MKKEQPYLTTITTTTETIKNRKYNPKFGDDKVCECGHPYYRHFDSYEQMDPVGCKYCQCYEFKEDDGTKVTVLFPGGFKPMHQGHLNLIQEYTQKHKVEKIKILVGPKERDGITQADALLLADIFMDRLYNKEKVTIEPSKYPSPVLTAFKEVENAKDPCNFTLATSKKGKDYERAHDFFTKHQKGEKYYDLLSHNVNVVKIDIDMTPIKYRDRTDEYNETPISSTVLRQDVVNKDFVNFKTNYPYENINLIVHIWTELIILENNRTKD